ncbi:probable tRNA(His) guanylyltransferase [Cimex lectularius]|uniref:tRNA(His) guanylyltransferase n=1 Tax=Cimex lectularius TaxID=79782 RepID=A0A8I6SAU9_CIMLE|nr:probable tRNA(His) guanylyltransferase [Cimex lectularius]
MAKSKFEYVRDFEVETKCLQNCWIVVRIDGKGFHKFTDKHGFRKPNDARGLTLMSRAAARVMNEFRDVVVAFGHSDEYSFVFKKNTDIYSRRSEKILSLVTSLFSSSYVFFWPLEFPEKKLLYAPSFDARIVLYPTVENLRDYMSWRQADVHVNNLYNTCFWSLVLIKGLSREEAQNKLSGTVSSEKNELLFQEFNLNYNKEPEMFRKGTTLVRKSVVFPNETKPKAVIVPLHCDIIKDKFWQENDEILNSNAIPLIEYKDDLLCFSK